MTAKRRHEVSQRSYLVRPFTTSDLTFLVSSVCVSAGTQLCGSSQAGPVGGRFQRRRTAGGLGGAPTAGLLPSAAGRRRHRQPAPAPAGDQLRQRVPGVLGAAAAAATVR